MEFKENEFNIAYNEYVEKQKEKNKEIDGFLKFIYDNYIKKNTLPMKN